jgi:hypothetical protein
MSNQWNLVDKHGIRKVIIYGNPHLFSKVVLSGFHYGYFREGNLMKVLEQGLNKEMVRKSLIRRLLDQNYM